MTTWRPQPKLRQKKQIDSKMTDLEIFLDLDVGDIWSDAGLVDVYRYARKLKPETVPKCWQSAMEQLDSQLEQLCPRSTWTKMQQN